ncbi:MAG: pentapeptide repeat-containing protein [Candidatus Acidiferrales bacterium]
MLSDSGRAQEIDKRFDTDISEGQFANQLFIRLVSKGRSFTKVDFKYSIFDTCYLRSCKFDSCDFTGCRFLGTNLHGSTFSGCKFDYAIFERTLVEDDILDTECPGPDNIKMRFARTLRMNYQQLGDAASANKAIEVELQASKVHKLKAWRSNESYYRKKYSGGKRLKAFLDWLSFMALDFIWGNGESVMKALRAIAIVLILMAFIDVIAFGDPHRLDSYIHALLKSPQIFLGTASANSHYWGLYLTGVVVARLIAFGFLLSIIIKRSNRR